MPIVAPDELPLRLAKRARLMAFDVGERTIGIAICDPGLTLVSPIETIRRTTWTRDSGRLRELVAYWTVGGFVVGLAYNMDGSEGASAQRCRAFARNLLALDDLPLAFWDERLSSFAAADALAEIGRRPKDPRARLDHVAAAVILESYLRGIADARRGGDPA
ncbi:MAG: Holliday junction resolvase RuvX [Alphaproteobacteria bacterium]|nr:Holliday junction resolvase RuvX [Alphaproteobacteria bacterium]